MLMTDRNFFFNRQNVATHLDKVMKTMHDTVKNCLSDKRVVAWRDDHKVFRNFPVAFTRMLIKWL